MILKVDESKDFEIRLRNTGDIFKNFQDISLVPFAILTALRNPDNNQIKDFKIAYVNNSALKLMNIDEIDFENATLLNLMPNHKKFNLFQKYVDVVEHDLNHDIEVYYEDENVKGWFRNIAVKFNDGVAVSFLDITPLKTAQIENEKLIKQEIVEREIAEKALNELQIKNKEYLKISETLPFGIWKSDSAGRITYISQEFADLFGVSSSMLLDFKWINYFPVKVVDKILREWSNCLHTFKDFEAEYGIDNISGERKYILSKAKAVYDEKGKISEWIGINFDITKSKRIELQLNEIIKERDVLITEIHHRVKNNLQIISSLLNLQSTFLHDQSAINSINESQMRVKAMAIVHEILYNNEDFASIELETYVNKLLKIIFDSYINTRLIYSIVEIENIRLNLEDCINIGLIINELVTNSIKHAFKNTKTGSITIEASKNDTGLFLVVKDNGDGYPGNILASDTFGIQLVIALVNQMEGELECINDNGLTFKIKLKLTGE